MSQAISAGGVASVRRVAASARAQRRDQDVGALFAAHHPRALRLAWMLTGNREEAEDAVSEAMANVYVQWRRGKVEHVGPYLRRAVVNQVRSTGRRKVTGREKTQRLWGDDRGTRAHDDDVVDRDLLMAALETLPDQQRAAVVLRFYEDMSQEQAAEALGISVGAVKSQTSRGVAKLRDLLGPEVVA